MRNFVDSPFGLGFMVLFLEFVLDLGGGFLGEGGDGVVMVELYFDSGLH